ncbi:MAG: DUF1553 domain-containing protein [Pirellulales bacterium]
MRIVLFAFAMGICLPAPARADEFFRDQVAPILERRCLACHGAEEPKGGLSLADGRRALAGGDSGQVIAAGDAQGSLLLDYVSGDSPLMPKEGPPLDGRQVAAIREWIGQGAPWPADLKLVDKRFEGQSWWSLEPLKRPQTPVVAAPAGWPIRTPLDAFVLAELNRRRLAPSPQAGRRTIIRRLTYNLHGLPPTPQEIEAFESDRAPDAYERLVDRLLASPRYGERWARHWLDLVHFGETHGYDKDKTRENAWPYRDYVVQSLNEDKPYSLFVREQLAGDVLYPHDPDAVVATGLIAAGPWDFVGHVELREGTTDKDIARSNDRDDMLMTTVSTFLSVTAHCARCHDHKFDPILQADYYRLQAVFAGVDRADRPYHRDPELQRRRAALGSQRQLLAARQQALDEKLATFENSDLARLDAVLADLEARRAALPAGAAGDDSPTNGYHSAIMARPDEPKWVQVDLGEPKPIGEIHLVPARPTDFPDTPGFGFPVRFAIELSSDAEFSDPQILADHTGEDFANPGAESYVAPAGGAVARYVRIRATRLWPRTNDYVFALAELRVISAQDGDSQPNLALGAGVTALDSIEAGRWSTAHLVDGFDSRKRFERRAEDLAADGHREGVEARIEQVSRERQQRLMTLLDDATRSELDEVRHETAEVEDQLASLPPPDLVYAAASDFRPQSNFTPADGCRPIHLLQRGNVASRGDLMAPGALSCLPWLEHHFQLERPEDEASRRVALARWITDPANPLTRRSIVNRVWQYHFGRGLVDTPNDFGRMGSQPTHPALLDWLATEFLAGGESLKRLHRLILTSSVYRQSSAARADGQRIDAGNRYLWRMNRARLDAESVRDAALFVAGKLDQAMGGPSARQFVFKDDHSPVYDYERFDVEQPGSFRRGVYRFIVRSVPDPFMDCLDSADPSILTPQRNTTLTALQALAMLNNPFMLSQSRHFARRLEGVSADPAEQVRQGWLLALGRPPRSEESEALMAYAKRHGLANACRLIFNSNEFLFVD